MNLPDEVAQHRFGNLKVGDNSVLDWADGRDVAGSPAQHHLGAFAHGQHLADPAAVLMHRNHRRLTQNNALTLDIHQGVGRA